MDPSPKALPAYTVDSLYCFHLSYPKTYNHQTDLSTALFATSSRALLKVTGYEPGVNSCLLYRLHTIATLVYSIYRHLQLHELYCEKLFIAKSLFSYPYFTRVSPTRQKKNLDG